MKDDPISVVVAVGTPHVVDARNLDAPISVCARPGSGGSLLIETSTSINALGAVAGVSSAAKWTAWPKGDVSADASDTLLGPVVAIRATASVASGIVEVLA
jgi:hypothetical protein